MQGIQLTAEGQSGLRRGLSIPEPGPLDPLQVTLPIAAAGPGRIDLHL